VPLKLPSDRINWTTSSFLIGTALVSITAVPWYIWRFGLDAYQIGLFFAFFVATGLSITLGYHRLFSHLAFKARWPVKLFTLIFGAAAFENTVLDWASDHRRHHKHVDHDDDPYDISKGLFYAHIGWLLFKLNPIPPRNNVKDLEKDRLVMWQENNYVLIAVLAGFVLPALLGFLHGGWVGALGGFLIAGVARIVFVQHCTFFINSLCHSIGRRPYSSNCSARDSAIMALFTFGEGYHNYHHEFQHDFRNGVKWWQFDPTKWTILLLEKLGLASDLRRVPEDRILLAQLNEARRQLEARLACPSRPVSERLSDMFEASRRRMDELQDRWNALRSEYQGKLDTGVEQARATLEEIRRELRHAFDLLQRAGFTG